MNSVHDSSHATKESAYAQEGVLILLMHDGDLVFADSDSPLFKKVLRSKDSMSGFCHVIAFISHKAKRVSSSTSMAETLAAVHGKEIAQLVAVRLTEILGHGTLTPWMKPTPLTLFIEIQEQGLYVVPIDHMTDCHDLFQLAIGEKGVPQDRYQRVYVMSLREDRIKGIIRRFFWIPTAAMIADAMTKSMISFELYDLLTWGYWRFESKDQQPLMAGPLMLEPNVAERDIVGIGSWPKREAPSEFRNPSVGWVCNLGMVSVRQGHLYLGQDMWQSRFAQSVRDQISHQDGLKASSDLSQSVF